MSETARNWIQVGLTATIGAIGLFMVWRMTRRIK